MLRRAGDTFAVASDALCASEASLLPSHRGRPSIDVFFPIADVGLLIGVTQIIGRTGWPGALYSAFAFLILAMSGCHRAPISPQLCQQAPRLLALLSVGVVPVGLAANGRPELRSLLRVLPLVMVLVVIERALLFPVIQSARARGRRVEPVVIIGAGRVGVDLTRSLQAHPEYGLRPVGFLDTPPAPEPLPVPLLGSVEELDTVLDGFGVRRVIIAFGQTREAEIVNVLRACYARRVEIHVVPRFFELGVGMPSGREGALVWGLPLLPIERSAPHRPMWCMKRVFDVVMAAVVLVVTLPVFGLVALAVRLGSAGPVFFRQKRVGEDGKVIEIIKFRTLRMNESSDILWAPGTAPLVTPVGRFLRATSLDELPQLINVLRGDMSLVGPRPERPYYVDEFSTSIPRYADRHRVPAGMTGWAQINGLRGDTSIEDRTRFDNFYIEHWSLWRDLTILVRTASVFLGRAAR